MHFAFPTITLASLEAFDRNQFVLDDHSEVDGEIISRQVVETPIDEGLAFRIVQNYLNVGGVVVKILKT